MKRCGYIVHSAGVRAATMGDLKTGASRVAQIGLDNADAVITHYFYFSHTGVPMLGSSPIRPRCR